MSEKFVLRDSITNKVISMDYSGSEERSSRENLIQLLNNCPIPDHSILSNLGLFFTSKTLSRILFMHEFYKTSLNIQGQVFDFGTRWGQNIALFMAFRGMYEPFNRHRKIVGFDTFDGFPNISEKDGQSEMIGLGNIPVINGYKQYLDSLLIGLEKNNSLPHLKNHELVQGDATQTIKQYFIDNPHALVSHAYFDFDLYEPTKICLEEVLKRASLGAIIGFDEINDQDSPGETVALLETIGIKKLRIQKFPWVSRVSFVVLE
jgi:hypothetical protein